MQRVTFEQLCADYPGAFGFTRVDTATIFSIEAGVYHDYISGKNVLTFGGTDSLGDWFNNITQALAPPAAKYTSAMTVAADLQDLWVKPGRPLPTVYTPTTPSDWLITGHSLGGGLAAAASVVSGFRADTFNAAGVNYLTVQQFCQAHPNLSLNITLQGQLQSRAAGLVTSYVVDGEVLNYAQDGYLGPDLGLPWPLWGDLPVSIGVRVPLDSGYFIFGGWLDLYTRYYLHGYFVESLLLSYDFPLN